MASYAEKLRDPRWQRKRLEIMERENFTCQQCGSKTNTLTVHHGYYETGLEPWEYADNTLHCLCEDCHRIIQGLMAEIHRALALMHVRTLPDAFVVITQLQQSGPAMLSAEDSPKLPRRQAVSEAEQISELNAIIRRKREEFGLDPITGENLKITVR